MHGQNMTLGKAFKIEKYEFAASVNNGIWVFIQQMRPSATLYLSAFIAKLLWFAHRKQSSLCG